MTNRVQSQTTNQSTIQPIKIGYLQLPSNRIGDGINACIALWKQYIDNKGGLLGRPVVFVAAPIVVPSGVAIGNATRSLLSSGVNFFLGPSSDLAIPSLIESEKVGIPNIIGINGIPAVWLCGDGDKYLKQIPCTKPNSRRFQYGHGFFNTAPSYLPGFISLIKIKKAKTIAFIANSYTEWMVESCQGGVVSARDNGLQIVMDTTFYSANDSDVSVLLPYALSLSSLNPDGVAICTNDCSAMMAAFQQINWLPKAITALQCVDNIFMKQKLGNNAKYMTGPVQWDPRLRGPDYTETSATASSMFRISENNTIPSPKQFMNAFQKMLGYPPDYLAAGPMAALLALEGSIRLANSTDPNLVNQQLNIYYETSFFGILAQNRYGYNDRKPMVILQIDMSSASRLVAPIQSADFDFIYPMPTFDEREYMKSMYGTSGEKAIIGIISFLCIIAIGIGIYLFHHRQSKQVRSSSLIFSLLIVIGTIISFLSCLTWPVENNSITCSIRHWIVTIGALLVIAPLLAKTYRIARLFNMKKVRVVNLTDQFLMLMVCVLIAPQIIINLIWSIVDPLQAAIIMQDPLRPSYNNTSCQGDTNTFLYLTLSYFTFLLLILIYLAYRIRSAYEIFDESKPIVLSVFVLVSVFALVGLAHAAVTGINHTSLLMLFLLRSIGICVAFGGVLIILFGERISRLYYCHDHLDRKSSLTMTSAQNTLSGFKANPSSIAISTSGSPAYAQKHTSSHRKSSTSQQGTGTAAGNAPNSSINNTTTAPVASARGSQAAAGPHPHPHATGIISSSISTSNSIATPAKSLIGYKDQRRSSRYSISEALEENTIATTCTVPGTETETEPGTGTGTGTGTAAGIGTENGNSTSTSTIFQSRSQVPVSDSIPSQL